MARYLGWAVALGVSMALALGPTAPAGEAEAEKPAEGAAAAPAATEPAKAPPIPAARVMPWNSRDEPWHLFPVLPFNTKVYGWVDVGYTHVKLAAPSGFAGVTGPNDRDDRVLMNQTYLVIERVANPGKAGFDFGGRMDLLFGTDSRYTEPAGSGLGASWNSHNMYGYDIPQAYLEFAAAAQPLTFRLKAGHFYSPLGGGEALKAPDRFFYSLTYSALYGAPLTSTGALASVSMDLPLGSQITLLGGADRGWNRYHGNPDGNDTAYYAGVQGKTAWGTKGFDTSLSYIYARSNETANPFIPGLKDDATLHSVAFQQQIFRRLNLSAGYCHGEQQNGSPFDGSDAQWRGFTQELVYQINRIWSVGVRHEKFRDLDGARVGQVGYRHKTDPVPPLRLQGRLRGHLVRHQLQADREHHDPQRGAPRQVRRHQRLRPAALPRRHAEQPDLLRLRRDLPLLRRSGPLVAAESRVIPSGATRPPKPRRRRRWGQVYTIHFGFAIGFEPHAVTWYSVDMTPILRGGSQ